MRKKILSFLLILAIFFTILPVQTVSAATDDEEAKQEGIETAHRCSGDEEDGSQAKEQEAEHHTTAIAIPIYKYTRRYRHEEIAQIGGYLNERRVRNADMKCILEMLVEHIEDGTREAPQEEERRDENERDKIFLVGNLSCFCCFLYCF